MSFFRVASYFAGQPAGELLLLLSRSLPQTREARRQASSRLAELLKFIPLCILQYPPFFLPLPKQQGSRHLGYFKFAPPHHTKHPYLFPLLSHTHEHIGYFKRKWIHVFFASFTKVLDFLEKADNEESVLCAALK